MSQRARSRNATVLIWRLVNGLFHGVEGMRVGGMRRLEIAPHLAYGARGVPGVIPPGAVLTAEITILEGPAGAA